MILLVQWWGRIILTIMVSGMMMIWGRRALGLERDGGGNERKRRNQKEVDMHVRVVLSNQQFFLQCNQLIFQEDIVYLYLLKS